MLFSHNVIIKNSDVALELTYFLFLLGPIFALVSPWTKDTVATMKSIPHVYPYPQLEDQDLSDVDSHGDNIFKVKYLF